MLQIKWESPVSIIACILVPESLSDSKYTASSTTLVTPWFGHL